MSFLKSISSLGLQFVLRDRWYEAMLGGIAPVSRGITTGRVQNSILFYKANYNPLAEAH